LIGVAEVKRKGVGGVEWREVGEVERERKRERTRERKREGKRITSGT
jgi:hypothetical protein